jgi:NTE family protein
MGFEVDAFVGTSIGAVVAGLLAQDLRESYESFVDSISLDSIVALPPGFVEEGRLSVGREAIQDAPELFRSLIAHRGLDTSPLRGLLEAHIDESKIRASGKDLGIVTVDLSNLSPDRFLEDMEEGKVLDYLMPVRLSRVLRHRARRQEIHGCGECLKIYPTTRPASGFIGDS